MSCVCICICISIYIYIYIGMLVTPYAEAAFAVAKDRGGRGSAANLRTTILDFRGFDSSRILILGGEIPRPRGNLSEISSRRILDGLRGGQGPWAGGPQRRLTGFRTPCLHLHIYIYIFTYIYIYIYIYVIICTYNK